MGEQQSPVWNRLQRRLEDAGRTAVFTAENVVNNLRYRWIVPPKLQEQASIMTDAFASELMAYISDHLLANQSFLELTEEQKSLVKFLIDSSREGTLTLRQTIGRVQRNNMRPYLVKVYEAEKSEADQSKIGKNDLVSELIIKVLTYSARFVVRWDVKRVFPLEFTIIGHLGPIFPKNMNFIILPQKAEKANQVDEYLGLGDREDVTTHVCNGGNRVIIDKEFMYQGAQRQMTTQYFLVGSFTGPNTDKTYWVYGSR